MDIEKEIKLLKNNMEKIETDLSSNISDIENRIDEIETRLNTHRRELFGDWDNENVIDGIKSELDHLKRRVDSIQENISSREDDEY